MYDEYFLTRSWEIIKDFKTCRIVLNLKIKLKKPLLLEK
jgi:hypothetical protein